MAFRGSVAPVLEVTVAVVLGAEMEVTDEATQVLLLILAAAQRPLVVLPALVDAQLVLGGEAAVAEFTGSDGAATRRRVGMTVLPLVRHAVDVAGAELG